MNTIEKRKNNGFSLVELIIVLALMGILSAILAPQYFKFVKKSQETKAIQQCEQVVQTASIELVLSNDHALLSSQSNSLNLLSYSTYMDKLYEASSVSDNSIQALTVNTNNMVVTYAQYKSNNNITVYYNGTIYSLTPILGSEYTRLLALLGEDSVSSKSGWARTKALQILAMADGTYTDLTDAEISYLQGLVTGKDLTLLSGITFSALEWVPVSNSDGSDVMMVISNAQGTATGAPVGAYFIYYKGHYFYKAHQTTGDDSTEVGGYSRIADDGSLSPTLDDIIANGDLDTSLWKMLN